MSDIDRSPIGQPLDDSDDANQGEVTEEDYEEAEDMGDELNEESS